MRIQAEPVPPGMPGIAPQTDRAQQHRAGNLHPLRVSSGTRGRIRRGIPRQSGRGKRHCRRLEFRALRSQNTVRDNRAPGRRLSSGVCGARGPATAETSGHPDRLYGLRGPPHAGEPGRGKPALSSCEAPPPSAVLSEKQLAVRIHAALDPAFRKCDLLSGSLLQSEKSSGPAFRCGILRKSGLGDVALACVQTGALLL